jgi:hypothetical protein
MAKLFFKNDEIIRRSRRGLRVVYHEANTPVEDILNAIDAPGTPIKKSGKFLTRRVENWVVKSSRAQLGLGVIKRSVQRGRYRQAWVAANFLARKGVAVPKPIAFVERRTAGLIWSNVYVSEFLQGCSDVEKCIAHLVHGGYNSKLIEDFLEYLAQSINRLCESGAYHQDLSGKNIYTHDGRTFYFIDLDGVVIGKPYTESQRLKNHIQLYDSFCDLLNDRFLVPFIQRMCTPEIDLRVWMPSVRKGQAQRRLRIERIWEKQGVSRTRNG